MNMLVAMLKEECPRCRKASMFKNPPVHWKDFTLMKETCPNCQLKFQVEPGFFIGAMYVSYAFIVALIVITAVTLTYLFDYLEAWVYIVTVIGLSAALLPLIYRYSRVIFLYLFGGVKYQGD